MGCLVIRHYGINILQWSVYAQLVELDCLYVGYIFDDQFCAYPMRQNLGGYQNGRQEMRPKIVYTFRQFVIQVITTMVQTRNVWLLRHEYPPPPPPARWRWSGYISMATFSPFLPCILKKMSGNCKFDLLHSVKMLPNEENQQTTRKI